MIKRIVLLIVSAVFLFTGAAAAADSRKIAILPIEVHSLQDAGNLETQMAGILAQALTAQGMKTVTGEEMASPAGSIDRKPKSLRQLGIKYGADYVLWGSLTWFEQQYSLDIKVLETFGQKGVETFFAEGNRIDSLFETLRMTARRIALKVLDQQLIARVQIAGNDRIESDAIRRVIRVKGGDLLKADAVADDIRHIYKMGYFDDVRAELSESPEGSVLTYSVKEKPTVRLVKFNGNRVYDDDELKENVTIHTGSILNIFKIGNNADRIVQLYKDKNYHNVKVTYETKPLKNNQVDLVYTIEEGDKVKIQHIVFDGNDAFDDKALKKIIKTSEEGFFSWLTSSGELDQKELDQDVRRLLAYYNNNGYIDAKVGEPDVVFSPEGIDVTFKIVEGQRYQVGQVDVSGDLVLPKEELLGRLKITGEEYYNSEIVRNDVLLLNDIYSDEGYAYAEVKPVIDKDPEKLAVTVTYRVDKGNLVTFEKIIISGNSKTRDKVIRRELSVYEQELYSGKRLKRSVRNLYRLDYFEDVKVDTRKGATDDKMVLEIGVTEKPTGAFSFGGGYSTIDQAFIMASVTQKNLFGRGQTLQLSANFGGRSTKYNLAFVEPWLFDIPLSASFSVYNWDTDYDTYDKNSMGGGIGLSYPVWEFTRVFGHYGYDDSEIENISDDASDSVKELEGVNITSSVTTGIRYDSRDKQFNPTEGGKHSFSVQYAGLGGNIGFTKFLAETGQYFPLFWETVGFLHARAGYVTENAGQTLPDYEKFYLGGINSLRGFDYEELAPTEINSQGYLSYVGGNKFVQFNAEYLFPMNKDIGVMGLLFFDTGDVYASDEEIDLGNLRESVGAGFRWFSPIGPIQLMYGIKLDPKEGESKSGQWEFSMGSSF